MSALELENVVVEYERRGARPVQAVAGASVEVERGQIVGLVGESGCGKSTLARAAVGMVAPVSGTIRFEGREVRPLTRGARPRELARLQLVFQNPFSSLNPRRRVGEQIGEALSTLGLVPRGGRSAAVAQLLDQVGLAAGAARGYPHEFSGGQRQRIAIARALAARPSVIVLDEPLASLDASAQAQIANLLGALARELDLGLLLISHDLAIVRHVADEVAVMYLGKIVETAPTQALWAAPLHPYSEALIGAVPRADGAGTLPEALPRRGARPVAAAVRLPLPPRVAPTSSTVAGWRSRHSSSSRRPGGGMLAGRRPASLRRRRPSSRGSRAACTGRVGSKLATEREGEPMTRRVRSKAALLAGVAFVAAAAYRASTGSAGPAVDTLVVDRSFEIRTSDPQRAFEPTASIVDRASTTRY